jgi:hypothetical protein
MAFPEEKLYRWNFNYNADNWKKFIELQMQHPDQTYQNFVKNNLHYDPSLTTGF